MKNLRQYWPQHGDEQWEDTQVLLCVDDVSDLGISNAEINELSLNKGVWNLEKNVKKNVQKRES